jgi:molybdopterin converting factor small subunit
MKGVISFHPVDPGFFETLVEPLVRGEKTNPEVFLQSALRMRRAAFVTRRYREAMELQLELLEPPPPPEAGSTWDKVKSRLERFDYRVPALARVVAEKIEVELTLRGRPFLITERAVDRVVTLVADYTDTQGEEALRAIALDQLKRVDASLVKDLEPENLEEPGRDSLYRDTLLRELREVHDWARELREGDTVSLMPASSRRRPDAIPWRIIHLHSRAVPFWYAKGVDGLEGVCRAAGLEPPSCLAHASYAFAGISGALPEGTEIWPARSDESRELGAYVAPRDVPELLAYLVDNGARIIQVATRHGEGPACSNLLRKIRECAKFAEEFGVGYLEASGIYPVLEEPSEVPAEELAPA